MRKILNLGIINMHTILFQDISSTSYRDKASGVLVSQPVLQEEEKVVIHSLCGFP